MSNNNETETPNKERKGTIKNILDKVLPSHFEKRFALLLLSLGITFFPAQPLVAKAAQQQYSAPTAIVQMEEKSSYDQEQFKKGKERIEKMISSLEANNSASAREMIKALNRMLEKDPEAVIGSVSGIGISGYKVGDLDVVVVNGAIQSVKNSFTDLTERFKEGEKNINEKVEELRSSYDKNGKPLSAAEKEQNSHSADLLEERGPKKLYDHLDNLAKLSAPAPAKNTSSFGSLSAKFDSVSSQSKKEAESLNEAISAVYFTANNDGKIDVISFKSPQEQLTVIRKVIDGSLVPTECLEYEVTLENGKVVVMTLDFQDIIDKENKARLERASQQVTGMQQ